MKTIQIFLGGGVKLLHGDNEFLRGYRNDVIDPVISQLNSQKHANYVFITKDYTDLIRSVVKGEHQKVYDNYITREADVALFIIDGEIGNITKQEIDSAVASAKKTNSPIVFIYGKNITDNEILRYLNQEGIYYQHFFDNRDLAAKIKADLETSVKTINRNKCIHTWLAIVLSILVCGSLFAIIHNCNNSNERTIDFCTAQLDLMRYYDVNALTGAQLFNDDILSKFKYEDSVMTGNDRYVFPVICDDTIITISPPFFRLKIQNKHRNTIVFIEAVLEIDKYSADSLTENPFFIPIDFNDVEMNHVEISDAKSNYLLKGFRQNVAYGETDDRYFFYITAQESCSFRMRVRTKSQTGDYMYSNYVYLKYSGK